MQSRYNVHIKLVDSKEPIYFIIFYDENVRKQTFRFYCEIIFVKGWRFKFQHYKNRLFTISKVEEGGLDYGAYFGSNHILH